MRNFVDTDRVLASVGSLFCLSMRDSNRIMHQLVVIKTEGNLQQTEQSINHVVMLKTFVDSIKPVWQALAGATSEELRKIRQVCSS
jgi:DNA mismatch repair protein MSH4